MKHCDLQELLKQDTGRKKLQLFKNDYPIKEQKTSFCSDIDWKNTQFRTLSNRW